MWRWSGLCQLDLGTFNPILAAERVRLVISLMAVATMLTSPPPASAGPICEDRGGEAVRCEDPRAMPLGWAPSLDERLRRPDPGPPEPTPVELAGVFALIFLLFALIALMPDFDGWTAGPSGEDDDDEDNGPHRPFP